MNKAINVIGREYEWSSETNGPAPYPPFDEMCVNESRIPHAERFKECYCEIRNGVGEVEWLTQGSKTPSDKFNDEIVRAFKANGLKVGAKINVAYGIRDYGLTAHYVLTVK